MSAESEDPRKSGPGRQDRGGSGASKNGPGTKNNGFAGKAPKKGNPPRNGKKS